MKHGFIFIFFDGLIRSLKYLDLVELFKFISVCIAIHVFPDRQNHPSPVTKKAYANTAIDVFIISKWALLCIFWCFELSSLLSLSIVAYLIATNLFTYFLHQVWGTKYVQTSCRQSDNHRFLRTLLAVAFSVTAYAYLYDCHFDTMINTGPEGLNALDALSLSIATALTLAFHDLNALTTQARLLLSTQLLSTFIFIVIILSNSIPNHISKGKSDELQE